MCRKIMAFRYSHVCRVRHAHHELTACNFFSVRTAHPALVHSGSAPYKSPESGQARTLEGEFRREDE